MEWKLQVTCKEDFREEEVKMQELEGLFDVWNNPSWTTVDRMKLGGKLRWL
jgi:hypothetical protein